MLANAQIFLATKSKQQHAHVESIQANTTTQLPNYIHSTNDDSVIDKVSTVDTCNYTNFFLQPTQQHTIGGARRPMLPKTKQSRTVTETRKVKKSPFPNSNLKINQPSETKNDNASSSSSLANYQPATVAASASPATTTNNHHHMNEVEIIAHCAPEDFDSPETR